MKRDGENVGPNVVPPDGFTFVRRHYTAAQADRLFPFIKVALALIAGFFAAKSLLLGFQLERALPFPDQWVFIARDYFPYIDGRYRWINILDNHGEHRIALVRVVLFADAIFFKMKGWLPLIAQYGALAVIGVLLARLASDGRDRLVFSVLSVALLWSICQYENLSQALQVCFSFVHLFTLLATLAFARALTDDERPWRWLTWACVCDFLAANSLASGLLTPVPVLAVALLLRKTDRRLLVFLAWHLVLAVWYFWDVFNLVGAHAGVPLDAAARLAEFIGFPISATRSTQVLAGSVGLAAFALTVVYVVATRKKLDPRSAVLFSLALFVVAEATFITLGRAKLGMAPRYSTAALVFYCSLLGFFTLESATRMGRICVMILAVFIIVPANYQTWERVWMDRISSVDKATAEFGRGEFNEQTLRFVIADLSKDWLDRYMALGLGPFSRPFFTWPFKRHVNGPGNPEN